MQVSGLQWDQAVWIDANTYYTLDGSGDLLPDEYAVRNSLANLLNCPIGARGPIFNPTYGTLWTQFLQEPIDDVTANKMNLSTIQAIQTWEPRISIDTSSTFILPDYSLPGYRVQIAFTLNLRSNRQVVNFNLIP